MLSQGFGAGGFGNLGRLVPRAVAEMGCRNMALACRSDMKMGSIQSIP